MHDFDAFVEVAAKLFASVRGSDGTLPLRETLEGIETVCCMCSELAEYLIAASVANADFKAEDLPLALGEGRRGGTRRHERREARVLDRP